jgi:hypothetical protein
MERNSMSKNGIPEFDGQNYEFWTIRMKTYVHAHGFEVWKLAVYGYKALTIPPTNDNGKKISLNNSKSTNALLNGLCDLVYTKLMHCIFSKEIWDKL